jgi:alkaline phosphatase D
MRLKLIAWMVTALIVSLGASATAQDRSLASSPHRNPAYSSPRIIQLNEPISRIALLGCIRQYQPVPALQSYVDARPDLSIWVGDNIYVDTQDKPELIAQGYEALARLPGFSQLRAMGQHIATWDDHDYGDNNAGAEYPLKAESTRLFTQFWGLQGQLPHPNDGIFHDRIYEHGGQRLHVIMLDVRTHRDKPDGNGDILGERQWQWLEGALKVKADLTLLVSGSQIFLDRESGSETWDQYPKSLDRLMLSIRQAKSERLVFITGDQHYGEVAKKAGALDFDAIELQFAGLNQTEEPEFNSYRDSPAAISVHSMGLIDVQWSDDRINKAHLVYRTVDTQTGNTEFTYRVNFDALTLAMDFPAERFFLDEQKIQIATRMPQLQIRYTLDGTDPNHNSQLYSEPFSIRAATQVKAAYFDSTGFKRSRDFAASYSPVVLNPAAQVNRTASGLRYRYFEGEFKSVPDFRAPALQILRTGISQSFDVTRLASRKNHYGLWFDGFIEVKNDGLYRVSATSDDGVVVLVNEALIVDNDGSHAARTRSGLVGLKAGLHPVRIGYFQDTMGAELSLNLERKIGNSFVPLEFSLRH